MSCFYQFVSFWLWDLFSASHPARSRGSTYQHICRWKKGNRNTRTKKAIHLLWVFNDRCPVHHYFFRVISRWLCYNWLALQVGLVPISFERGSNLLTPGFQDASVPKQLPLTSSGICASNSSTEEMIVFKIILWLTIECLSLTKDFSVSFPDCNRRWSTRGSCYYDFM